jgi:hypothetical protein
MERSAGGCSKIDEKIIDSSLLAGAVFCIDDAGSSGSEVVVGSGVVTQPVLEWTGYVQI